VNLPPTISTVAQGAASWSSVDSLGPLSLTVNAPSQSAAGPALSIDPEALASSLSCPASFTGSQEPVLLLHGVAESPTDAWGWSYAKVLPPRGFYVCTVALPDLGRADVQLQAEHVVHAVRTITGRSGGKKVDVVAFSTGALSSRAAVKWWPDVRGVVDDLVLLGAPNHGTVNTAWMCALRCIPTFWQAKPGSAFLRALNAGDETPGDISYTSVYSRTDLPVQPALPGTATPELAGASNIAVQDVCVARPVDHPQLLSDPVAHAAVIDALTQPGAAAPARIDRSACLQLLAPGIDALPAVAYQVSWWKNLVLRSQEHQVNTEPGSATWAVP
jgi:triacylglycerol esterase/lipase EstA (alpha/beta hydrolase family)